MKQIGIIVVVIWLLFFHGYTTLQNLSQSSPAVVTTIQRGAELVLTPQTTVRAAAAPAKPAARVATSGSAAPRTIEVTATPAVAAAAEPQPAAAPVVQVVPNLSQPIIYAQGSDVRPTPLPPLVIPTPLTAGVDYAANSDGTCVTAPRAGKTYRFCQIRPMNPGEIASVGDYLRTGMIAGEEVK